MRRNVGMDQPPVPIDTKVPGYGEIIGMSVSRDDPGNGTTIIERRYFVEQDGDVALLPDDVIRTAISVKRSASEAE